MVENIEKSKDKASLDILQAHSAIFKDSRHDPFDAVLLQLMFFTQEVSCCL